MSQATPKSLPVLGVFSLAMITIGSVDSIRNLPATALFGSSLVFFFLFGALVFLLPSALVSAELASSSKQHGGVYVPITDNVQPNPYLQDSQRDVTTSSGMQLTKINPAFMTRQISLLAEQSGDLTFHLTSLNPIRPANKAYDWETEWLQSFQLGAREQFDFITSSKGTHLRYMAPLFVEENCLQCHSIQG